MNAEKVASAISPNYQKVSQQDPARAFASVTLKETQFDSIEKLQYSSVPVKQNSMSVNRAGGS